VRQGSAGNSSDFGSVSLDIDYEPMSIIESATDRGRAPSTLPSGARNNPKPLIAMPAAMRSERRISAPYLISNFVVSVPVFPWAAAVTANVHVVA
jgi:hypothetical protein